MSWRAESHEPIMQSNTRTVSTSFHIPIEITETRRAILYVGAPDDSIDEVIARADDIKEIFRCHGIEGLERLDAQDFELAWETVRVEGRRMTLGIRHDTPDGYRADCLVVLSRIADDPGDDVSRRDDDSCEDEVEQSGSIFPSAIEESLYKPPPEASGGDIE